MERNNRRGRKTREAVRFAVVGQGYFGQAAVLPAFAQADGCELRAIFSGDEGKLRALKRRYGVGAALGYDQYDEYLRSGEIDAVYIALPNDMHSDYVVRAADAGIHVLCEKPIATNSHDAERMVSACADKGVKLMVAYRLHFEAATLDAIERVQRGDIGRLRFFSSTFAMQVREDNIRTQREHGGGPLLDIGIYCVNAVRSFFRDEPIEVTAMGARSKADPRFKEIDEQGSAILRFSDERVAQITFSFGAYDHSSLTVVGEKGRLTLDPAYEEASALVMNLDVRNRKPVRKTFAKRDQVAAELVAFAQCVRSGRDPEPSGEEGLADLRVLEAIQRSVESGEIEKVETVQRRTRPSKSQDIARKPHGMPQFVHAEPPGRD